MKLSDQVQLTGQEWYPDSTASAHITNDGSQLQSSAPYLGNDQVIVGNGDYLPITHIGSIPLHTPKGILPLDDVLVCPAITKSLLSVSKLTSNYPCEFTFDDESVLVKDKLTKQVITESHMHNDLYVLKDIRFRPFTLRVSKLLVRRSGTRGLVMLTRISFFFFLETRQLF